MIVFKIKRTMYIYDEANKEFYDEGFNKVNNDKHKELKKYVEGMRERGFDFNMWYTAATNYISVIPSGEQIELKSELIDKRDEISETIADTTNNVDFYKVMADLKRCEAFLGIIFENKLLKKETVAK